MSHPLPLRKQGDHQPDDGSSATKLSRLKIALPSEDADKKVLFLRFPHRFLNPNTLSLSIFFSVHTKYSLFVLLSGEVD